VAELPLVNLFHAGSLGYGLIGAMWGAGSLVGALAARKLTAQTERRAMVVLSFVTAAGLASVSVIPLFVPILGAMLVSGCSDAIVDVAAETLIQRRAPDAVRSRVVAAVDGLVLTAFAGSFLFAGVVVAAIGPRAAYAVAGAGCALTGVILFPILRERTVDATAGPAAIGGIRAIGDIGEGSDDGAPTNSPRPALELGGAAPTTGA